MLLLYIHISLKETMREIREILIDLTPNLGLIMKKSVSLVQILMDIFEIIIFFLI